MGYFDNFLHGLSLVLTWQNLGFALTGCLLGTLVGVLPGVGALATVSMLLSMVIFLDPLPSLVMLSAIYYGAQYGGSTTAILCNLPGEATSIITCLDGHAMARDGRAGAALATAALSSLFAGIIATVLLAVFAPLLASFALSFNSPEYFSLLFFGLVATVAFSQGTALKAFAMVCLGALFGCVGSDIETGALRFTFGFGALSDGLSIVAVAMGIFGLGEIVSSLTNRNPQDTRSFPIGRLWISLDDLRKAAPAAARGTAVGSVMGVLPGGGMLLSTFMSYMLEQKVAKDPSRFGKGAIEGVAAPEAANNAAVQTSFIPALTLGIPPTAGLALLLGAMIMQGVQPGPLIMTTSPDLFWGLVASMIVGNIMLVVINLPMVGIWVQLLRVPYRMLYPAIVVFCCIGAYAVSNNFADLAVLGSFTAIGVLFAVLGFQPVPLLLGFLLGPLVEEHLRRALVISGGDATVFFERPISLAILILAAIVVISAMLPAIRSRRAAFSED